MHGEDDELIPLAQAREIFERAAEPKKFLAVPRGKHRLRVDPVAVEAAVFDLRASDLFRISDFGFGVCDLV
jgi:fermentation-respiration switch protein FrsA (DUF1100 family)